MFHSQGESTETAAGLPHHQVQISKFVNDSNCWYLIGARDDNPCLDCEWILFSLQPQEYNKKKMMMKISRVSSEKECVMLIKMMGRFTGHGRAGFVC